MKRVVTGMGSDGRDTIVGRGVVQAISGMRNSTNETRLCWATPADIKLPHNGVDPVADLQMTLPAPGETRFVLITFPPGSVTPIHATPTLDYVAVVSGDLWLVMEDGGECQLNIGDSVVQTGTRHAWANRSAVPCTIAAVMIGALRA